jgi:hypothetical protein
MDLVFRTLVIAVVVAGVLHTMESHFREKARRRRSNEALLRLKDKTWKNPR